MPSDACCVQLYYSDFLRLVNSKDVALARIDEAAGRIYFSLRPEAMSSILGSMAGDYCFQVLLDLEFLKQLRMFSCSRRHACRSRGPHC